MTVGPARRRAPAAAIAAGSLSVALAWAIMAPAAAVPAPAVPALAAEMDASPRPSTSAPAKVEPAWPSGDEVRRELQAIGFRFRVDHDSGDWTGWAPGAGLEAPPSMMLAGAIGAPATATFAIDLLAVTEQAEDVDATLTALLETLARVPLKAAARERVRGFVVEDLLTRTPELLEPCYVSAGDDSTGRVAVSVDPDTSVASLVVAAAGDAALASGGIPDPAACAPLRPTSEAGAPGETTTVRITVATTAGDAEPAYQPAEVTVDGSLVTLVLTFRNDTSAAESLTFAEPLASDTGLVEPGDVRLIVVRELEPGDYPFFSTARPDTMRGTLHVRAPDEG